MKRNRFYVLLWFCLLLPHTMLWAQGYSQPDVGRYDYSSAYFVTLQNGAGEGINGTYSSMERVIGAFVGNELRGVSEPVYLDGADGCQAFFIRVWGDADDPAVVTFRLHDSSHALEYEIGSQPFGQGQDATFGIPSSPVVLTVAPIESISLSNTSYAVMRGETTTAHVALVPETHSTLLSTLQTVYQSSNESVFTVSTEGVITGTGNGTAMLTASVYSSEQLCFTSTATVSVGSYTVADVTFSYSGNVLTMSSATEYATIHYTLNGTEPTAESPVYTSPLTMTRNCTVKAVAVKENYNASAVTSYDVNNFVAATPTITVSGLQIVMATVTEGAAIRYTTDGTAPTATTGTVYAAPVEMAVLTDGSTVQAVAVRDGYNDSGIATFEYHRSSYTTAVPTLTIQSADSTVAMTCATAGAAIRYTLDGTMPTESSTLYTAPFNPMRNCAVTAIATAADHFASAAATLTIGSYKVQPVAFSFDGTLLTMTTPTAGATIRYTTDGTAPTATTGTVYSAPVSISSTETTVRAIALREGWTDADITSWSANRTLTPTFAENRTDSTLTISCATAGSTIYYTMDGSEPTTASTVYTGPIILTRNCTVRAIAMCEGYYDSFVTQYEVNWFQTATPVMSLDYGTGRLTITCETAGSAIHYAIGTGEEQGYTEPLTLADNSSVRAWATAERHNDSEEATLTPVPNGSMAARTFTINGGVTTQELLFVRNILRQGIEHLDMTDATLTDGRLDSEAFSGMSVLTARLPRTVDSVGDRLFNGCRRLAAIVWNATTIIPASAMAGIDNPNLLLYVNADGIGTNAGVRNLVVNQIAREITLSDPAASAAPVVSDYNFYCPIPFTARHAVYSHIYTQESGVDGICKGWETLSLPFDVAVITHRVKGEVTPFGSSADTPHFWLYSLGSTGFEASLQIEANRPYVISMPENQEFATRYCLGNDSIMFTATDVAFAVTAPQGATVGNKTLHAGFMAQDASDGIFAMNIGERYDDSHAEGSIFVPGLRAVRPFEAYATTTEAGVRYITLFGDDAQGIDDFRIDNSRFDSNGVYDLGGRRISDSSRNKRFAVSKGRNYISTRISHE